MSRDTDSYRVLYRDDAASAQAAQPAQASLAVAFADCHGLQSRRPDECQHVEPKFDAGSPSVRSIERPRGSSRGAPLATRARV
jgi:hypothetical protein